MIKGKAVTRYAKALLEVAKGRGEVELILEELRLVDALLTENPDLAGALLHPRIPPKAKKGFIDQFIAPQVSTLIRNFLCLIVDKKREGVIPFLFEAYKRLAEEAMGILKAQVISAYPLEDKDLNLLRERLEAVVKKTLLMETQVDPQIIGGLVVKIDSQVMDGSVVTRLQRLGEKLKEAKLL